MKKYFIFIALSLFVSFAILSAPTHADEHDLEYDDKGQVKVDKDVENTYNMPKLSGGFILENTESDVKPILSLKVVDDIGICLSGYSCKAGLTFGDSYVGISTHLVLADIYEVSVGPTVGYNTNQSKGSVGISFLMVKF